MNRHRFAQFVGHPAPRSHAFFPRGRAHTGTLVLAPLGRLAPYFSRSLKNNSQLKTNELTGKFITFFFHFNFFTCPNETPNPWRGRQLNRPAQGVLSSPARRTLSGAEVFQRKTGVLLGCALVIPHPRRSTGSPRRAGYFAAPRPPSCAQPSLPCPLRDGARPVILHNEIASPRLPRF